MNLYATLRVLVVAIAFISGSCGFLRAGAQESQLKGQVVSTELIDWAVPLIEGSVREDFFLMHHGDGPSSKTVLYWPRTNAGTAFINSDVEVSIFYQAPNSSTRSQITGTRILIENLTWALLSAQEIPDSLINSFEAEIPPIPESNGEWCLTSLTCGSEEYLALINPVGQRFANYPEEDLDISFPSDTFMQVWIEGELIFFNEPGLIEDLPLEHVFWEI